MPGEFKPQSEQIPVATNPNEESPKAEGESALTDGDRQCLEEVEGMKDDFKGMIQNWHDNIKPDYVFLNECSATPYGYLIREAWRRAYSEKPPKFYRINPRAIQAYYKVEDYESHRGEIEKMWVDYIRKRIKNNSTAKAIIFDEHVDAGTSLQQAYDALTPGRIVGGYSVGDFKPQDEEDRQKLKSGATKEEIRKHFVSKYGVGEVLTQGNIGADTSGDYTKNKLAPRLGGFVTNKKINPEVLFPLEDPPEGYPIEEVPPFEEFIFTGRIVKSPRDREKAKEIIKKLKEIGKSIGEEISGKADEELSEKS